MMWYLAALAVPAGAEGATEVPVQESVPAHGQLQGWQNITNIPASQSYHRDGPSQTFTLLNMHNIQHLQDAMQLCKGFYKLLTSRSFHPWKTYHQHSARAFYGIFTTATRTYMTGLLQTELIPTRWQPAKISSSCCSSCRAQWGQQLYTLGLCKVPPSTRVWSIQDKIRELATIE